MDYTNPNAKHSQKTNQKRFTPWVWNERGVLHHTVIHGQAVFIVGPSSSGKTTLCNVSGTWRSSPSRHIKEIAGAVMREQGFSRKEVPSRCGWQLRLHKYKPKPTCSLKPTKYQILETLSYCSATVSGWSHCLRWVSEQERSLGDAIKTSSHA